MQEPKTIVTGDYLDTGTGIRFLEDIRGTIHSICPMVVSGVGGGVQEITNNYYCTNSDIYKDIPPTVIQTASIDTNWVSINDFNRINNTYTGGFTGYTTPIDKSLHIASLVASQGSNTISVLGLYSGGNLLLSIPLYQDVNINFFRPIVIPPAKYVEIKFRPGTKKLSLVLYMIGYLI